MKIVSITGPESSGKTSFARYCAHQIRGSRFIEEYSRIFLEKNYPTGIYPKEAVSLMLDTQISIWQEAIAQNPDHLILDGDIFIYKIWIKVVFGETWDRIEKYIADYPSDLVVLCRPDIPWEPDPLRSNPENREMLFELYLEEIKMRNIPYLILEGPLETRNEATLSLVARALSIDQAEN